MTAHAARCRAGGPLLRCIDRVMIKVADLDAALDFDREVFGLRPMWREEDSVGLVLPEDRAESVLYRIDEIPAEIDVNDLVNDLSEAVARLAGHGRRIVAEPFPIAIGSCAVVRDPFDRSLRLPATIKGLRPASLAEER